MSVPLIKYTSTILGQNAPGKFEGVLVSAVTACVLSGDHPVGASCESSGFALVHFTSVRPLRYDASITRSNSVRTERATASTASWHRLYLSRSVSTGSQQVFGLEATDGYTPVPVSGLLAPGDYTLWGQVFAHAENTTGAASVTQSVRMNLALTPAACNAADIADTWGDPYPDGHLTPADVVKFFQNFFAPCRPNRVTLTPARAAGRA